MFKLLLPIIIFASLIDGYVTVNVLPSFLSLYYTFYKKEPTFMDRAILSVYDMFYKKEPTYMDWFVDILYYALALFTNAYTHLYEIAHLILITKFLMTIQTVVVVALAFGTYNLIKGRHRTPLPLVVSNPASIFNFINTLPSRFQAPQQNYNQLQSGINQLERFNSSMKMHIWLKRLDIMLKARCSVQSWTTETLLLLNHEITDKLGDLALFDNTEIGYKKLTETLLRISSTERAKANTQPIIELTHRVQGTSESIEQYGKAINNLGEGMFKTEHELNTLFIKGLKDQTVRQKTANKFFKTHDIPNKALTLKETISYATKNALANEFSSAPSGFESTSTDSEPIRHRQHGQYQQKVRFNQTENNMHNSLPKHNPHNNYSPGSNNRPDPDQNPDSQPIRINLITNNTNDKPALVGNVGKRPCLTSEKKENALDAQLVVGKIKANKSEWAPPLQIQFEPGGKKP